MSIESKIIKEETSLSNLKNQKSKLKSYLESDKVKDLFARYFALDVGEQSYFKEDNGRYELILQKIDSSNCLLKLERYEVVEIESKPESFLRRIFEEHRVEKYMSHDALFELKFKRDNSYEIRHFSWWQNFYADEVIEALDDMLFDKWSKM